MSSSDQTRDIHLAVTSAQSAAREAQTYASTARVIALQLGQLPANSLFFQGTWDTSVYYASNSVVEFNGALYLSLIPNNKGHEPDTSPSQWQVFAESGGSGTVHTDAGVTGDGSSGAPVALAHISQSQILGRATAGTGPVEQLTSSQVTALLAPASTVAQGAMSAADKLKLLALPPSITGTGTISVDGSGVISKSPWLNPVVQYVSPFGNDANDGKGWDTAKLTGYAGYAVISAAGSGTLRMASKSSWGGPVPGQGCWLRGDGMAIPGWLPAVPSIIEMDGAGANGQLFAGAQAYLRAGSNDPSDFRTKPGVWIACSENGTVEFRNVRLVGQASHAGNAGTNGDLEYLLFRSWRLGWDYPRNSSDGSIQYLQITSSSRSAGLTTHTVTLPNPGVAITSAVRGGGSVRFTIPRPAGLASFPPWTQGGKVWFESSDPGNFPSGAYTIENLAVGIDVSTDWSFSITQAGADHTTANPGYIRSIISYAGSFLDLESSSAQFPSTQYRVVSADIVNGTTGTIVVTDIYGGHYGVNATQGATANIGQLAHQERAWGECLNPTLRNCSAYSPSTEGVALYQTGPTYDIGSINAIPATFIDCFIQGYYPPPGSDTPYDSCRMAAMFGCPGGNAGVANIKTVNCTGAQTSFRVIGSGFQTSSLEIDIVSDTNDGYPPPLYEVDAATDMSIMVSRRTIVADAIVLPAPIIRGTIDPLSVSGPGMPIPCIGPSSNGFGDLRGWTSGELSKNLWTLGQVGTWGPDLKITGRHPAAWRSGSSVVRARFANLIPAPGAWGVIAGSLTTTGIADPFGGTGACSLTDTGSGSSAHFLFELPETRFSFAAGGRYVIAGWVNMNTVNVDNVQQGWTFTGFSDVIWKSSGTTNWSFGYPTAIRGWQYFIASDVVVSASPSQQYALGVLGPPIGTGATTDYFGMSAFYVPPDIDDNDFYEFIGTLQAQPYYLPPGTSGTFEGQKLIAHGGLGIDTGVTKVAGAGSGQLTIGSIATYEPRYAADGTTIIGWIPVYNATVNP